VTQSRRRHQCSSRTRLPLYNVMLALVASLFWISGPAGILAQMSSSIPEEIEWTWEVRPPHPNPKLPNVLLLGDSITRNYFPQVTKDLEGIANVYLMASSTSVGDPRLPSQIAEFSAMEHVPFRVVHFNNGMHGWGYTEAQFESGFPVFLGAIQALSGNGRLIWATITPVRPEVTSGATNPRIDARNAIAKIFVETRKISVDDQHALMGHHFDLYEDAVHFNKTGSAIMGDQAAAIIEQALQAPTN
jgi:hypothetical protein